MLCHGSHRVAGLRHVCSCLGGFCDLRGRAWAIENCDNNNKSDRVYLVSADILQSLYAAVIAMAAFNAFSVSNLSFISITLGNGDGVEISIRLGTRWQQISYSWSIRLI